jgi:gluconokinase
MTRILVMGVAGAGKSTLAGALAEALSLQLIEADDHHDSAARAAMARGEGLDDARRAPWLARVAAAACEAEALPGSPRASGCVMACSALKPAYREVLAPMATIFLRLTPDQARARLAGRTAGHFAGPALAASQFADLDPPQAGPDVLVLDAMGDFGELLAHSLAWLNRTGLGKPT